MDLKEKDIIAQIKRGHSTSYFSMRGRNCEYHLKSVEYFLGYICHKNNIIYDKGSPYNELSELKTRAKLRDLLNKYKLNDISDVVVFEIRLKNPKNLPYYKFLFPKYFYKSIPSQTQSEYTEVCKYIDRYMLSLLTEASSISNKYLYDINELLNKIVSFRKLAEILEKQKSIKESDIKKLNTYRLELKETNAIEDFIYKIYKSIVEEFISRQQIIICKNCGVYSTYYRGKEYCDKRCRKSAAYKRYYYGKRHKKIRKNNRRAVKELRTFYKEKKL
ncbi:hypothetical protein N9A72_00445 [bacterium]|nr:hypothetical protein [bacterium]